MWLAPPKCKKLRNDSRGMLTGLNIIRGREEKLQDTSKVKKNSAAQGISFALLYVKNITWWNVKNQHQSQACTHPYLRQQHAPLSVSSGRIFHHSQHSDVSVINSKQDQVRDPSLKVLKQSSWSYKFEFKNVSRNAPTSTAISALPYISVFWVTTPWSLVVRYKCYGRYWPPPSEQGSRRFLRNVWSYHTVPKPEECCVCKCHTLFKRSQFVTCSSSSTTTTTKTTTTFFSCIEMCCEIHEILHRISSRNFRRILVWMSERTGQSNSTRRSNWNRRFS